MKESYLENKNNQDIEKITKMFGEDFELEKDPTPEDLFNLVFSTILSKNVHISGEANQEQYFYILPKNGEVQELDVRKDYSSTEIELEGWEGLKEPWGGELIIDALTRIPVEEEILYVIKKSKFPSKIEPEPSKGIPLELRKKLERFPSIPEAEFVEVYKFDKEKIFIYIKENENNKHVQQILSGSENTGKCKYWLSEY